MHWIVSSIVLVGGCGFSLSAGAVDAAVDDVGGAEEDTCLGTGLVRACLTEPPSADVVLDTQTLDTDVAASCTQVIAQLDGTELCVIAGTSISVIGVVTTTGTRPLVLAATGTITISSNGILDASSDATRTGAGANDAEVCGLSLFRAGAGEGDSGGGGGGAGGGFGTRGANGGVGDNNDNQPPTPHKGAPGIAGMQQPLPTSLRGGCPGGAGGGGANSVTAIGPGGGASGGAVYLIAHGSLVIAGHVFASGAGGHARSGATGFMDGGAGGGSGGMVGLDSPTIEITGIVAANGGSGAGGGDYDGGAPGVAGSTTTWDTAALGGVGAPCCGAAGGRGTGGASVTPTAGALDISGGGGGGGGAGIVWIDGTVTTAAPRVSPPPTPH